MIQQAPHVDVIGLLIGEIAAAEELAVEVTQPLRSP